MLAKSIWMSNEQKASMRIGQIEPKMPKLCLLSSIGRFCLLFGSRFRKFFTSWHENEIPIFSFPPFFFKFPVRVEEILSLERKHLHPTICNEKATLRTLAKRQNLSWSKWCTQFARGFESIRFEYLWILFFPLGLLVCFVALWGVFVVVAKDIEFKSFIWIWTAVIDPRGILKTKSDLKWTTIKPNLLKHEIRKENLHTFYVLRNNRKVLLRRDLNKATWPGSQC